MAGESTAESAETAEERRCDA